MPPLFIWEDRMEKPVQIVVIRDSENGFKITIMGKQTTLDHHYVGNDLTKLAGWVVEFAEALEAAK